VAQGSLQAPQAPYTPVTNLVLHYNSTGGVLSGSINDLNVSDPIGADLRTNKDLPEQVRLSVQYAFLSRINPVSVPALIAILHPYPFQKSASVGDPTSMLCLEIGPAAKLQADANERATYLIELPPCCAIPLPSHDKPRLDL
jgi:hypothetical protein